MTVQHAAEALERPTYKAALVDLLYQLADDELFLGHRDSEWLGLAPDIEEDVAFSSIAQDEVGHAAYFYQLLSELGEGDADDLAYGRAAAERRNARLVERPNGDWAYTIVRHLVYDVFEGVRLEALASSSYAPLAHGAVKIRREERYHLLHMETWFTRLGQAGGEAKERLEKAVAAIWPEIGDLFSLGAHADVLVAEGILPVTRAEMVSRWEARLKPLFEAAQLAWPGTPPLPAQDGRLGQHSPDLDALLDTMAEVYRLEPAARW
ncbi:1,2-phenylacetyl-CoA epoxidase subunit PaaC [Calditerricola satsumensis]|uniref:Phenylacetate-CoA oxygenase subunit PaaI n=3 Tax=Calditerricola satsumensis TaxID=373054 RepID=A0A8J3B762_9BACI|nr:1,2-phenylacetyl-CoA epoxidase subunit PaaC [Calditerricola satsumensis]GGJ99084.1 phenylacetate-CoA oxygenase subunit PaaI [Calditerricola satsumensis]